jgi:hypothetical protein
MSGARSVVTTRRMRPPTVARLFESTPRLGAVVRAGFGIGVPRSG